MLGGSEGVILKGVSAGRFSQGCGVRGALSMWLREGLPLPRGLDGVAGSDTVGTKPNFGLMISLMTRSATLSKSLRLVWGLVCGLVG